MQEGLNFSEYLIEYLKRKGISKAFVAKTLEINYETFRSKCTRDSFSYAEVCFLDFVFTDLRFLENTRNYYRLRKCPTVIS